ncbi:hypothetical protein [Methylophilus sp. TWE2]|uniref:hypothetical protein n=1 Tax=Methylophilus sp. TWE2 TaxID=1662285 RepID=UPI000671184B|nr:hypothetical protein [Methylophilus sp. TWE2]AKR42216.1 hypothetical protein ACJ67_01305 [Methylophilus sp. TWE2]
MKKFKNRVIEIVNIKEKTKLIIDEELLNAGLNLTWDINELHFHKDSSSIIEQTSSDGRLSKALINHFFPSKVTSSVLAHYTSLEKFESIISTRTIRLNCLLNKLGEAEFRTFSEDYGLAGHYDENGRAIDEVLMEQIFFCSFTNLQPKNEDLLWSVFGKQNQGVKLQFEITVNRDRSELRPMKYSSKIDLGKSLFKTIATRLKQECNRDFVLRGISRIGAFYLPVDRGLESEEETRLLVKTWGSGTGHDLIVNKGSSSYFPIPIDDLENDFCHIKLVSVVVGRLCSTQDVATLLQKNGFGHVPLLKTE